MTREEAGPKDVSRVEIGKKTRPLVFPPVEQNISLGESLPSTDATSPHELSAVPRQNSCSAISSYPRSLPVSTSEYVPSIESSNTTTASICPKPSPFS